MLSFGVLIAFWSPKQSEIEESSLESISKSRIQRVWDPAHSTRTRIIAHSTRIGITSGCRQYTRLPQLHPATLHYTRLSPLHPAAATFHSDVSHPEFCCCRHFPSGCITSWIMLSPPLSIQISYIRNSTAGWERRAFCIVPRCSPEASWYLRPTFWDILRYFALDIWCLNPQTLLVTHQL